ncbi:sigma-70 family RNA polymerase sigma factor [Novipirellula maiorica]|uniref:sigma-70 family RNA polymerase sigma factor n=1 Tax=Novipirellula maiorica TaxID=1265734 RepID=UPI00068F8BF3|nr:sigma-70 family RNA polymerase sigma factor [Rhodopirellula maiorica]
MTKVTEDFVSLLATHQRTIFLYLNSLLPSGQDVDDLFQETCMICWREFEEFTPGTNFGAWACTIAFNQVRAWRTKRGRQRLVFSDEFLESVANELDQNASVLDERATALTACVEKLPDHHRELIRQRYSAEESIGLIAGRLGRSPDAIYRMLSRIRESLHQCVDLTMKVQRT